MTNLKKYVILGAVVLTLGATTTAFAASNYNTPAEAVAGLTGNKVEDIIADKNTNGKTYGEIANEAGQLDEFKEEMLAIKKQILDEKVAAGIMTQAEADSFIKAMEENMVNCDGSGSGKGQMMGSGFGGMMGQGRGQGQGRGLGNGQGLGNGTCQFQ